MEKIDIVSLTKTELKNEIKKLSLPSFRADQIYDWLHKKDAVSFSEMTNLSKALISQLNDNFVIFSCSIEKKLVSRYDDTVKYLFKLHDGEYLECVVMKYKYGYTICVSTQVGCKMGCAFCASGIGGFKRQLRPSEILGQIYAARRDLDVRISRIVLMGMGEPLDNFDNVMRFLELVGNEDGLNIGMRHISLSTCGITERLDDLAARDLQLTLSVSLHAPDDATRSRIMPANRGRGVDELFRKCSAYYEKTGRRISFEYAMIDGVNDSAEQAELLARRVKPLSAHVNLIPLNHVDERHFSPSTPENMRRFVEILEKNGVNVTVRRRLGSDVDASCGQLRRKSMEGKI